MRDAFARLMVAIRPSSIWDKVQLILTVLIWMVLIVCIVGSFVWFIAPFSPLITWVAIFGTIQYVRVSSDKGFYALAGVTLCVLSFWLELYGQLVVMLIFLTGVGMFLWSLYYAITHRRQVPNLHP